MASALPISISGLGSLRDNYEIGYRGLVVAMKPSTFLKLVPRLPRDQAESVDFIKEHIESGGTIGPSTIYVTLPRGWKDGDYTEHAEVVEHEGRNRAYALMELYGDNPVPTHLIVKGIPKYMLRPEWIEKMRDVMWAQTEWTMPGGLIRGPLFEVTGATPNKRLSQDDVREVRDRLGAEVPLDVMRAGIETEMEHTDDPFLAGKIALDHLKEFPDYYERLAKMEARAKAGLAPNPGSAVTWAYVSAEMERIDKRHRGTSRAWQAPADAADLKWTRERIKIQDLPEVSPWSPRDVKRYAQLAPGAPPVLLVQGENGYEVWDGAHRVAAARARGDQTVDAFVGRELAPNARSTTRPRLFRTRVSFDRHFDEVENRFPDFGTIELHADERAGEDNGSGSDRQFGYCTDTKPIRIAFASKVEKMPHENIDGLVAHEFGHALDHRYGKRELERRLKRRLPDGVERRADAIAQAVFGRTVKYDGADVQCVSCRGTSPRPKRLGS